MKLAKYILILPVLCTILVYTSCKSESEIEKEISTKLEGNVKENKIESQKSIYSDKLEARRKEVIDTKPFGEVYTKEQKHSIQTMIAKHVAQEFNTNVTPKNLNKGRKRILVQFIVNTEHGNATDIKATAPCNELKEEAIRIIKSLPKFPKAKFNGNYVKVKYALPIDFVAE